MVRGFDGHDELYLVCLNVSSFFHGLGERGLSQVWVGVWTGRSATQRMTPRVEVDAWFDIYSHPPTPHTHFDTHTRMNECRV